jgi:hypothetical protein
LGEHRPIQGNETPEGRNANRRVVLVILGGNGMPEGNYGEERGEAEVEMPVEPAETISSTEQQIPVAANGASP